MGYCSYSRVATGGRGVCGGGGGGGGGVAARCVEGGGPLSLLDLAAADAYSIYGLRVRALVAHAAGVAGTFSMHVRHERSSLALSP